MIDENRSDEQSGEGQGGDSQSGSGGERQSGDPGRTPGQAEGDEQTVDESLAQKES